MTWTPHLLTILRSNVGKLTAPHIAKLVGKTENAVRGKINRLGLSAAIVEIHVHPCQWPYGEPRDRNFCGDPAIPDSSYCAPHHKRSRQPRTS